MRDVHAGGTDATPTDPWTTALGAGGVESDLLLGDALFDLWAQGDLMVSFSSEPARMVDVLVRYWRDKRGSAPALASEISTLTAENARLEEEVRRRRKLEEDRRYLARSVISQKRAGRSFRPGEIGKIWRAIRERRLVADGQGGVIVRGTDLRVLGPRSELNRTPATPRDPADRVIAEILNADLRRRALEMIEEGLNPQAADERRRVAADATVRTKMRLVEEGIAKLRAQTEAIHRQREETKELDDRRLRERSPVGTDRLAPATPGDGSPPSPSAPAPGGQAYAALPGRARLATSPAAAAAPSAPNARLVTSKAVLARQGPGGRSRKDASSR